MTDQIKRHGKDTVEQSQETDTPQAQVSRGRRSLIKGAAGTLPMILTLQSGAALARSSNLISSASPSSAKDDYGRTLCLEERSVHGAGGMADGVADLGEPMQGARVGAINERKYYWYQQNVGSGQITEGEMCERGGTYYHRRRWGWRQVEVKQGMLVSATSLSSFAGKIDIVDI